MGVEGLGALGAVNWGGGANGGIGMLNAGPPSLSLFCDPNAGGASSTGFFGLPDITRVYSLGPAERGGGVDVEPLSGKEKTRVAPS
jgi:hypothetical protein